MRKYETGDDHQPNAPGEQRRARSGAMETLENKV